MIKAVADTHTFIWYLAGDRRLSAKAREFINTTALNGDRIAVSSVSLIETVYLVERKRVPANTLSRLIEELIAEDSVFTEAPPDHLIAAIMQRISASEIPEMPDRIVAATAQYFGVPVISRDARIHASNIQAIW